jgi:methylmalonyl-CoA mutase C-terminal domain/subunit
VIAIASTRGQSSRSRKLASTPGPQSSKTRRPPESTRYPDCTPPGFGQAGEDPTTVSFTAHILAAVARKIRVVIAKPGLDGHDRGAKIIARALRDAGMEVIYTGLHQTPEQIVETAIQEDADAVGISILSGAHMTLVPKILDGLREQGAEDVVVVLGGTIPADDADELKRNGVAEVFTPGAPTSEIVDFLRERVAA